MTSSTLRLVAAEPAGETFSQIFVTPSPHAMSFRSPGKAIDIRWTVNEVVHRYPSTLPVLSALGVDTCCGGVLSLRRVAEKHRIDPEALTSALDRAVQESAS